MAWVQLPAGFAVATRILRGHGRLVPGTGRLAVVLVLRTSRKYGPPGACDGQPKSLHQHSTCWASAAQVVGLKQPVARYSLLGVNRPLEFR